MAESKEYHLANGYGYKICKCDKCGTLDNKFNFGLFPRENKDSYISKAVCKKCNNDLKIVKKDDFEKENIPGKCKKSVDIQNLK